MGRIDLSDGETLYLAAGAVVNGCVRAKGENITICGRGLLTGDAYPRFKGPGRYLLDLVDCRNLTVPLQLERNGGRLMRVEEA